MFSASATSSSFTATEGTVEQVSLGMNLRSHSISTFNRYDRRISRITVACHLQGLGPSPSTRLPGR
jgi:hypothetical protein